jgi:hypothetical protein
MNIAGEVKLVAKERRSDRGAHSRKHPSRWAVKGCGREDGDEGFNCAEDFTKPKRTGTPLGGMP